MMPQNYRPGLDVVRLAALLPVLCYHYCIEAARLGFAVPTALIGRGMADWVEVGLAAPPRPTRRSGWGLVRCSCTARSCTATTPIFRAGV